MNVTACLVTRGDVEMQPIINSLPNDWEKIVWDNSRGWYREPDPPVVTPEGIIRDCKLIDRNTPDLSVFGRYAAIEYATNDLIYVQDDDVIVSDPQAIVDQWIRCTETDEVEESTWWPDSLVVCNQPQEFRHDFYSDHSLVGFGAAFHRDAWKRAIDRFVYSPEWEQGKDVGWFNRCCDIVFTGLTPCVRVDVPKENLPYAYADDRMWRQPTHQAERQRMLDLVRRVRDEK